SRCCSSLQIGTILRKQGASMSLHAGHVRGSEEKKPFPERHTILPSALLSSGEKRGGPNESERKSRWGSKHRAERGHVTPTPCDEGLRRDRVDEPRTCGVAVEPDRLDLADVDRHDMGVLESGRAAEVRAVEARAVEEHVAELRVAHDGEAEVGVGQH